MSSSTNINLIGLDFETLKSNLKNYLKNNSSFKDYNFEGSNMSVLIDLLSYNNRPIKVDLPSSTLPAVVKRNNSMFKYELLSNLFSVAVTVFTIVKLL